MSAARELKSSHSWTSLPARPRLETDVESRDEKEYLAYRIEGPGVRPHHANAEVTTHVVCPDGRRRHGHDAPEAAWQIQTAARLPASKNREARRRYECTAHRGHDSPYSELEYSGTKDAICTGMSSCGSEYSGSFATCPRHTVSPSPRRDKRPGCSTSQPSVQSRSLCPPGPVCMSPYHWNLRCVHREQLIFSAQCARSCLERKIG